MFDVFAQLAYQLASLISPAVGAAGAIVAVTLMLRISLLPVAKFQHLAAEHGRLPRLRIILPMLIQLPVFAGMYRLATSPTIQGHTNLLLQHTLFGAPLGAHLTALAAPQLVVFAALIGLLIAVAYTSSRLSQPTELSGAAAAISRLTPYASAVFALFLPVAAALYLATSAAWTLTQTILLRSL